jgi:hypothetical protein
MNSSFSAVFLRRIKMKYFKTSLYPKLVALMAGAALFGLVSQSALALTQSGTVINNMALLSYSVGGTAQNQICSSIAGNSTGNGGTVGTTCTSGTNGAVASAFTVSDKINLTVAGGAITPVTPGQLGATTTFTVTNLGNAKQGYNLAVADTAGAVFGAATDNFNATGYTIYQDTTNNTAAGGACTTASAVVITTIPNLNAGASICVWVAATAIPAIQVNGDAVVVTLTAATTWPAALVPAEEPVVGVGAGQMGGAGILVTQTAGAHTAGVDVVFADAATVLPLDAAYNGQYIAYGAWKVQSAILSVTKAVTVLCDPVNGNTNPKNIPGAVVQYAITISNAATASSSATLSSVSDTLAASLAWDPKLISGVGAGGATCTSAGGVQLSATTGFGVIGATGTTVSGYAAPGLATQATTAGATQAAGVVTINYATLTAGAGIIPAALAAGALPVNSAITVYFNAIVQ